MMIIHADDYSYDSLFMQRIVSIYALIT